MNQGFYGEYNDITKLSCLLILVRHLCHRAKKEMKEGIVSWADIKCVTDLLGTQCDAMDWGMD